METGSRACSRTEFEIVLAEKFLDQRVPIRGRGRFGGLFVRFGLGGGECTRQNQGGEQRKNSTHWQVPRQVIIFDW